MKKAFEEIKKLIDVYDKLPDNFDENKFIAARHIYSQDVLIERYVIIIRKLMKKITAQKVALFSKKAALHVEIQKNKRIAEAHYEETG